MTYAARYYWTLEDLEWIDDGEPHGSIRFYIGSKYNDMYRSVVMEFTYNPDTSIYHWTLPNLDEPPAPTLGTVGAFEVPEAEMGEAPMLGRASSLGINVHQISQVT